LHNVRRQTELTPAGFRCGVGTCPSDWAIGFDEGTGFFIYQSPKDPSDNYFGVVSLTPLSTPTTK